MRTTALGKTSPKRMLSFIIFCAICLFLAAAPSWGATKKKGHAASAKKEHKTAPAKVAAPVAAPQIREWGPYLDVAYELTYWDKNEIKDWREKRDQEIGETLASYIATWSGKLAPGQKGAERPGEQPQLFRDRDYLRLAIAQTIDYLQSDNPESLAAAAKTIESLKGKASMPEIAYWSGMVKALQALERDDADDFVAQVYGIWNGSVLYIEKNEIATGATSGAVPTNTPFYYRNLINLVVNRAIIARKLDGLNALGPLFVMMNDRNLGEKDSEGKYTKTLVQRIVDGLGAPDSDRYRLNFTVAAIESKRLQQVASSKLDAEGMTESVQKTYERAKTFNDLCFKWAAGPRSSGVVMAAVDYLDMTSFAIPRLADNENAAAYKFFSTLPDQEGRTALLKSMAIFNDIAPYSAGGWERAGYQSRELYLKSTHRLWRAIMELSLWTGDYYLVKLNTTQDAQNIQSYATSMQMALNSYLNFLTAQQGRGFNDVIPDSAYFGAFEASDKVSYAYRRVSEFSTDNGAYNLWFTHRLLSAELFPLSLREVRQTSAALKKDGRYNLYLDYFLPLASRIKQSPAIKKWVSAQRPETATASLAYINAVDKLFAGTAPAEVPTDTQLVASFQSMREEMQRNPDHPTHNLLKLFYLEEIQKNSNFTKLVKEPNRLDRPF
ncbi:hypothetical protein [Geomonas edaphica]|uniref:hypothetical protein n=1 Tax=Geomonas edaphica TaxID=2570226 RepID=UPI0013A5C088|nr:hypothetical protein [Geomonas edaphica]